MDTKPHSPRAKLEFAAHEEPGVETLQELLADYTGTVILVSHDRDFLDKLATSVLMYEGDGKWQEYAGGYTDMLSQRGEGVASRKAKLEPKGKNESGAIALVSKVKRKLSFNEKYALENLPAKMDKLRAELVKLESDLDDANLFSRDLDKFEKSTLRHKQAADELTACEEQWLTLEMLREEFEG